MATTTEGTRLEKMADKVYDQQLNMEAGLEIILQEQKKIHEMAEEKMLEANKKIDALEFRLAPYVTAQVPKDPDELFDRLADEYGEWLGIRKNMQDTMRITEESIAEIKLDMVAPYNDNTGKTVGAL